MLKSSRSTPSWLSKLAARLSKKRDHLVPILAGSIVLSAVLLNFDFHYLEANLYDLRMSHGFETPADSNIVLIALDDKTTKELDDFSPLTLNYHSRFLTQLQALAPKAVGYLVDLNHASQVTPDKSRQEWSNELVAKTVEMQKQGTTFLLGTPFDVTGDVIPPFPLSTIPHSVAVVHKDGNVFSEDKITRRALLSLYGKPAFHVQLAEEMSHSGTPPSLPGAFSVPEVDGEYFFFRYHGTTRIHQNAPLYKYLQYSFSDVLYNRVPRDAIRGKIVLVGTLSKDDSSDFAYTPYSRNPFANPKLVVHANILDSIIHRDSIMIASPAVNGLITFLVTATVLAWIMLSTPLSGVFATLTLALVLMIVCQLLFHFKGLWIKESQPLVGIFVSYYLAVPYRLIREYKKRWDYQRKNEILTQVEEMKTHFISLVTHDLKTPVARIQGLAEVLLRPSELDAHPKAIRHIFDATEELNRFITSILELNKVESNHLQFRFESKDINLLIEKSAERFQDSARMKEITLAVQLDPLFPIKIDVDLISKVLNNLIDNAIKYSPKHSMIKIRSNEEEDWVIISISDQGIGLTENEIKNLFTRFYRAKNDTTALIPGTGLGLYLTKYFIEAHQGKIKVVSQKNCGSTFYIYLPIAAAHALPNRFKEMSYV